MRVIAAHSFRGGSGKSFVALNLAAISARNGIKTVVMDCDFHLPSFHENLPPQPSPTHYGNDFLLNEASIREIIYQTSIDNLDVIYADPNTKLGEGLLDHSRNRHDRITEKFLELRENLEQLGYQRIMLDTTPSLTLMSVSSLLVADAILVVHIPALHTLKTAVHTLLAVYGLLEKSLDRSFFLVYNQVPPTPSEEIEQIIDRLTTEFQKHIQIEVLGRIPLEITGKLLANPLLFAEASPILKHFQPIVKRLLELKDLVT